MAKKKGLDASKKDGGQPARRAPLNWDNARVFLELSRQTSFRSASPAVRLSANVLRRRLEKFERQLGVTLFTRHVDGVRLTEEGKRIADIAKRMELEAIELERATAKLDRKLSGEVRLAATEGLGSVWIAPRLVGFHRSNPDLLVDLHCAMNPANVLRLEADISIQLVRPVQKDLRMVKLGRLHIMPFAAKSYIDAYGMPRRGSDLADHMLIVQVANQVTPPDEYLRRFVGGVEVGHVGLRTDSSGAHYWAIAHGVGIGMLPTYMAVIGVPLVPIDLDIDVTFGRDIWLVYHPDSQHIPRVRFLIDWLIGEFSPQRFPWFNDEFIHPSRLPRAAARLGITVPKGGRGKR